MFTISISKIRSNCIIWPSCAISYILSDLAEYVRIGHGVPQTGQDYIEVRVDLRELGTLVFTTDKDP